ncbi:MAG: hypothetical protein DWQ08_14970 [Proteobacteria bacterium]|nr:MAG: hypothetical protein DWQ08_14970 [Pseudomonadota bacterium]
MIEHIRRACGCLGKVSHNGAQGKRKKRNALLDPPPIRRDALNIKAQDDVFFQVYWKSVGAGIGPAVILYFYSAGVLRFDCFGKGRGHFHVQTQVPEGIDGPREKRIFLPEPTAAAQIERALYEYRINLRYYLQQNPDVRVRNFPIDEAAFESALSQVEVQMLAFLHEVPELAGI